MGYDGGLFLRALQAAPLHWKTKAVGFAMATHGREGTGVCVVSIADLACATGLPCLSVERGLAELMEAGFLAGEEGHGRYSDHETLRAEIGPTGQ
jgi:hypothetical protein